jgi:hypothetical protein
MDSGSLRRFSDRRWSASIGSIYDADPADLGTFDIVMCGSVVIHLRDQLRALERIASLCDGTFISSEEYDRAADLIPLPVARYRANRDAAVVYWQPSRRTWRRMLWTAGFNRVDEHSKFNMQANAGWGVRHVVHHASASQTAGNSHRRSADPPSSSR